MSTASAVTPHCPHCGIAVGKPGKLPFPPAAVRCPHCRLIIGAGRARAEGADDDGRTHGSAAGVVANAARRADSRPRSREDIIAALRAVAGDAEVPVERLRMLDYQDATEADDELPELGAVLAAFGTWKAARAEAGA